MKKDTPEQPTVYNVFPTGSSAWKLLRLNAKRATRIYADGQELLLNLGWYAFNRNCVFYIHDKAGVVVKKMMSWNW